MITESFANTITCTPTITTTQVNRCIAAAEQLGFTGLRADSAFENIYTTTTIANAVYTGLYRLIDAVAASSILDSLWITIGPYVSTSDASWTALLGVYGTADRLVKKRPPAGTANAGWQKITDCVNDLISKAKARWIAGGGDPTKLYFQVFQEPGIGASDGPQTTDLITGSLTGNALDDAISTGFTGYWDSDETWGEVKDNNGVSSTSNIRGVMEFMAFMYPQLDLLGCRWVYPAFEASTTSSLSQELFTALNPTFNIHDIVYDETGRIEFDIHNYYGTIMDINPRSSTVYAQLSLAKINDNIQLLKDNLDEAYLPYLRFHSSEYGFKASWLFGTDSDADSWSHLGRGVVWRDLIDVMRRTGLYTIGFEELHENPSGGDDHFIMNASGNPSVGAKGVGQAHGKYIDVTGSVPWIVGGDTITWRQNTNETPV